MMRKSIRNLMGALALVVAFYCLVGLAEADVALDSSNFPDAQFLKYIEDEGYDQDGDGILNNEEIQKVTFIDCSNMIIYELRGIEHFIALKYLYCTYNQITSLDLSKNTALEYLNCCDNRMTELDLSGCSLLDEIICDHNKLIRLDVSRCPYLVDLNCNNNLLKSLDINNCPSLEKLYCSNNEISYLNVSNNTMLNKLECEGNHITELDLSHCNTLSQAIKTLGVKNISGCKLVGNYNLYCDNYVRISLGDSYIDAEPKDVIMKKTKATVVAGKKLALSAKLYPSFAKTTMTWTSSDTNVAKVNRKGIVTGVQTGTATITVTTSNYW